MRLSHNTMKPYSTLFLLVTTASFAQSPATNQDIAFHKSRLNFTKPIWGYAKVAKMIKGIKGKAGEEGGDNKILAENLYNSLSFEEKFTYNMVNLEEFSQNCADFPPVKGESTFLFAYIPPTDESMWFSDRQMKFFQNNRTKVIDLLSQSITRSKHVGLNYKFIITELKAKELIPLLLKTYNLQKKDHDILSVCMLMMKEAEYAPFSKSKIYKSFFGDNSQYRDRIPMTPAVYKELSTVSLAFYKSQP